MRLLPGIRQEITTIETTAPTIPLCKVDLDRIAIKLKPAPHRLVCFSGADRRYKAQAPELPRTAQFRNTRTKHC